MKRVITYGVFDYLHIGHVRLFKKIRKLFDENIHLTVAVHEDKYIKSTKPDTTILYDESERMEMIREIKSVDDVTSYSFVDTDIPNRNFDVLAVGPDQTNEHFQKALEYCKQHNKQVVIIPRTEGICSSEIKKQIVKEC